MICLNGHTFEKRIIDGRCPACKSEKDKRYIAKDSARLEARKLRSKQWRINNPERSKLLVRDATLKSRFGISLEQFENLLEAQKGLCALCGKPEQTKKNNLSVDHDHKTKEIRALLCHHCNAALGHAFDSPELLRKMADYLESHGIRN